MNTQTWMLISFVTAIAGMVGGCYELAVARKGVRVWIVPVFFVLLACQSAALFQMGTEQGSCPIHGVGEFIFFLGWALGVMYLNLLVLPNMRFLGVCLLPVITLCCASAFLPGASLLRDEQADVWLSWHVVLMVFSYAALGVAAVGGMVYLRQDALMKGKRLSGMSRVMPPLRALSRAMVNLASTGVAVMVLSLAIGMMMPRYVSVLKYGLGLSLCVLYAGVVLCVLFRGLPGRIFSWLLIALFVYSLLILGVLQA